MYKYWTQRTNGNFELAQHGMYLKIEKGRERKIEREEKKM